MRYSVLFVAVLILVSGFIAYFGDILGRWMGKKRLTLLRLRPRHTAYMVTAITGMLISALALTALVSVNSQFKKVLTEGEMILTQNETLSKSNRRLAAKNESLEERRRKLQLQVDRQRREVDEAREAALKAADAQVKAVNAQIKAARQVERLSKDIEARKWELARLRRVSENAKADVQAKVAQLSALQSGLARAQSALRRAQSSLATARDLQSKAEKNLKNTNEQLAKAQKAAAEQEKLLQDQQKALEAQRQQLAESQPALVEEGTKRVKFEQQASELLGGDIRFRQGDEIARGTISPRQSVFGIRGDLFSLLGVASEKAKKLGAGVGANGRAVAVEFQQAISKEYGVRLENESACVQMAAEAIAQSALQPDDALVQVVCARNSLAGEQVHVRLVLYFNRPVYRKGEKIAETKMDGRMSEGRVLLALVNFLQNEVSRAALGAGIVPVANPDPRASLGANPRTQVEGLMAVVDQIKSKNAKVNVEAYACADIFAADALSMTNMRFGVSKIE